MCFHKLNTSLQASFKDHHLTTSRSFRYWGAILTWCTISCLASATTGIHCVHPWWVGEHSQAVLACVAHLFEWASTLLVLRRFLHVVADDLPSFSKWMILYNNRLIGNNLKRGERMSIKDMFDLRGRVAIVTGGEEESGWNWLRVLLKLARMLSYVHGR